MGGWICMGILVNRRIQGSRWNPIIQQCTMLAAAGVYLRNTPCSPWGQFETPLRAVVRSRIRESSISSELQLTCDPMLAIDSFGHPTNPLLTRS